MTLSDLEDINLMLGNFGTIEIKENSIARDLKRAYCSIYLMKKGFQIGENLDQLKSLTLWQIVKAC